jgi:hypothetical protein
LKHIIVTFGLLLCFAINPTCADSTALTIGNSTMMVNFPLEASSEERDKLSSWLETVANSMTQVYGSLPLANAYIDLKNYRPRKGYAQSSSSPAPWAFVNRGEKPGVSFHVNTDLPLADFIADWTAYHELSHLFIPFPGINDIWFSEGLASYYQNVVRARANVVSEQQAWQALYDGFLRGEKDTSSAQLSLKELSPRMREKHSFMRVYWSGAYYFLSTDIALRTQTKHQQSLDTVLQQFKQCCLTMKREWTGRELANKFDELSRSEIFSTQYDISINSNALTGFEARLNQIGLSINEQTIELSTEDNAFHSRIMQPR